jgi:hypothetical protein
MKQILSLSLLFCVLLGFIAPLQAAAPKSYQVTGVVTAVSDSLIVLVKGKEGFEIARTPSTKVTGELKVGATITVYYRMTADEVEVKGDKKK